MSTLGMPTWLRRRDEGSRNPYPHPIPPYIPHESKMITRFEDLEPILHEFLRKYGNHWEMNDFDEGVYYNHRPRSVSGPYGMRSPLVGVFWPRKKTVGMPENSRFGVQLPYGHVMASGDVPFDLPLIVEFASIHHESTRLFNPPAETHEIGSIRNRILDPATNELNPYPRQRHTRGTDGGSWAEDYDRLLNAGVEMKFQYPPYNGVAGAYVPPFLPGFSQLEELSFTGLYDLYVYRLDSESDRRDLEEIRKNVDYIYEMYRNSGIVMKILELERMMQLRYDHQGDVRRRTTVTWEDLEKKFAEIFALDADTRRRNLQPYAGKKESEGGSGQ
jgi:hypothetical protein